MSVSFDRAAASYDETRGGERRGYNCAETLDPLFAHTGLTLAIGAGTGVVGAALRARGRRVVGVDISAPMLRRAIDRALPVVQADALSLPLGSSSVDDAYSVWVFHVVGDQAGVLRDTLRVLRPGGRYLIELTSRLEREDDEIARILVAMHDRLRAGSRPRDDLKLLVTLAVDVGFTLARIVDRTNDIFMESPLETAAGIERRDFAALWDIDAERWQTDVEPAIEALRALPEPGRPRERCAIHEVVVLEKPL